MGGSVSLEDQFFNAAGRPSKKHPEGKVDIPALTKLLTEKKVKDVSQQSKTDMGKKTDYGLTALAYAVNCSHTEAVVLLLEHGANPNNGDGPTMFMRPIRLALMRGDAEIVAALLKKGAPPNEVLPMDSNTPLHIAALADSLPCAKVLLEAGADPTIKSNGQTPLEAARAADRKACLEILAAAEQAAAGG